MSDVHVRCKCYKYILDAYVRYACNILDVYVRCTRRCTGQMYMLDAQVRCTCEMYKFDVHVRCTYIVYMYVMKPL